MKEDIKETRLANGLTILTDRMPHVRSVTLGFFYRIGSRNEPVELNGISHFIEHAVFKGTTRRTALDIAIEQDRLGGNLEAFTTHEDVGFAIKVIDDQLSDAFSLIADLMTDPLFDAKELKSEQRVIIEEMKMVEDSPEEFLGEIFSTEFFPGHPLGLPIAGTPETVRSFGTEITRDYFAAAFSSRNLVIAAAGNIDHEQIVGLAEKLDFPTGSGPARPNLPPVTAAPILLRHDPGLEQAHLILATPFVAALDERRYAADLLSNVLGGGMSSRLWQSIREVNGLAYSVGASAAMFRDCGFFSIFAGTSPEQAEEVVDLSIAELRSVVRDGIRQEELELAKRQAETSILLSLEDSAARAAVLAHSEILYGRHIPVGETIDKIRAVTVDDVAAIAHEFFKTESVAFAALGNLNDTRISRDRLQIT